MAAVKNSHAEGGTRTPTNLFTRPSNVRVYQFRHFRLQIWLASRDSNPNSLIQSQECCHYTTRQG